MSQFLITGGAGFIGSHICEFLLQRGHNIRILDNFSTGKKEKIAFLKKYSKSRYQVIEGDIRSFKTCQNSCVGMDYVIHQAACKAVPKSIKQPHLFNAVNIDGTLNLLQASVKQKIKRFVIASSSSVYGDSKVFPQRENQKVLPLSPYGITKLAGEHYCSVFSGLYGLETVVLRYFNVFGPRQDFDDMYSAVIVKFIRLFLNKQQPVVFGDGHQSRDFTYVENVVRANYMAALKGEIRHEVFNVAMGESHSVLYLIKCLNQLTRQKIEACFKPIRLGDIYKSQADISRIRKIVGFKPSVSFETGLKRTLEYIRQC